MVAGAARGLDYLHSMLGLTHADVKPDNMLVTRGLVVKISDFGLSGELCGSLALGRSSGRAHEMFVGRTRVMFFSCISTETTPRLLLL